MRRRRLLVVGPLPPPVGGVETVTKAVLESRLKEEWQLAHCNLTKGRAKTTQGKFDLGNFVWAAIHFSRMLRSVAAFRPHAVYMAVTATWSGFLRDSVIAWIAKAGGAKVVGHVHGGWFDRILARTGRSGRIVRASLRHFDALLVLGTKWRDDVDRYGFEGRCMIVPSTFRQELADAASPFRRNYAVREPKGLFVGQIGQAKGVMDLLHALNDLRVAGTAIKLTLVGPGQFGDDLERAHALVKELALEDLVTFTGQLQGDALYEQYRKADFLVLPSHFEGLPVVFFEAGAFGLPVIGTPVGAIPDLLKHGENALLVQPRDIAGLAAALRRLHDSADERRRLGTKLMHDIQPYTPAAVCSEIGEAVRLVLEAPGGESWEKQFSARRLKL
ncbi:MAG: hypothetical protein A3G27_16070 [Betaproteobacteria bacterium RIFCSPLOWO2_12_FULL_66_14]|nr:MAG: hypothetical protein A3G27_16070 [Betaproteobacteria bacterium RIFCSPLOWO2_12_FULL_66_14]